MRMFTIYTRPIPGCCHPSGTLTIVEVECERVTQTEDPSIGWLPAGEWKGKILQPSFLHESQDVPAIYYSHSIYETKELAQAACFQLIVQELDFEVRKGKRIDYTKEDITAKCAEIKEVKLSDGTPTTC